MIETIQDGIITQLLTITGIGTVDAWQGNVNDLEELLAMPMKLPAVFVIYHAGVYQDKKVIGVNRVDKDTQFMLIAVNKNLKGRAEGASASYTLIETIETKLRGYKVSTYGFLWPVREDLLLALGGILVYGLIYRLNANG